MMAMKSRSKKQGKRHKAEYDCGLNIPVIRRRGLINQTLLEVDSRLRRFDRLRGNDNKRPSLSLRGVPLIVIARNEVTWQSQPQMDTDKSGKPL